jgi:hypothetical protein
MSFDPTVFPRQLGYWTLHCLLNAAPSLGIALGWLGLWKHPAAVAAMFAAIATFILLYSALTSLRGPFTDPTHILSRALKLGAKIRAWISGISVLVLPTGIFMMLTPDYWCGLISISLVNGAARYLGASGPAFQPDTGGSSTTGFLPVFATTLLEGFILSFLLLMIAFFSLIFLQMRDRKKTYPRMAGPGALR